MHRYRLFLLTLLSSVAWTWTPAFAQTLPGGGAVKAGTATIGQPSNGQLTITQQSQRAVINWQNFSVGSGNSVTFQQPNSSAATLNRVTGTNASAVAGSINANGKVYLVNPNGIEITPTGTVDAKGGFIASTLGISNQNFMKGNDTFNGNGASASVDNQGTIAAGNGASVALIGGSVSNEGTISVPLGKVQMGAGEQVTLDTSGDGFLQVAVPSNTTDASGKPLVSNSGTINAPGGTVELKAAAVANAIRDAVNMSGTIQAQSVSGHDGYVVLGGDSGTTVVTGSVDVSGPAQGGNIDVTGSNVVLQGARLNASGVTQGGLVRVGGEFQGGKAQDPTSALAQKYVTRFGSTPALSDADTTSVDANSTINVSASQGSGGTAVIWSNTNTIEQGLINATGGAPGLGGAIEVSSGNTVQSVVFANLLAGSGGSILLDPENIIIDDDPNDGSTDDGLSSNASLEGGAADGYAFADNASGTTHIFGQTIMNVLSSGIDVILQASNDITWTTSVGVSAAGNGSPLGHLTLQAGRSVTISGLQMTLLDGSLTIIANDTAADGVIDQYRQSGAATLDVSNIFLEGGFNYGQAGFVSSYLTLEMLNGAGNTNNTAGPIKVNQPDFSDVVLDAEAGATEFYNQIFIANNITITGDIVLEDTSQGSGGSSTIGIDGNNSLVWTDQYTATITTPVSTGVGFTMYDGNTDFWDGQIKPGYSDAVRLDFGSPTNSTDVYTSVYGDGYPTTSQIFAAHTQFSIDPNSAIQTLADPASSILNSHGFYANTPGQYQSVGTYSVAVLPQSGGLKGNLTGSYLLYVPASGESITLQITPRPVTVTAVGDSYVYGSPSGNYDVTLSQDDGTTGIANGDVVYPVASVSGISGGQTMLDVSGGNGGYGFAANLAAGSHTYTVTGLTGPGAGNYMIDTASSTTVAQTLDISPALLEPTVSDGSYTYGSPSALVTLSGVLNGDTVVPTATISGISGTKTMEDQGGGNYAFDAHTAAGSYTYTLNGVGGPDGGNYTLDTSAILTANLDIARASISFANCCTVTSTYGTLAVPDLSLTGVLTDDDVSAATIVTGSNGVVTLGSRTAAGSYTITTSGLTGAQAGNYTLTGQTDFSLTINPLELTYTAPSGTATYGSSFTGSINLNGVLNGDDVSGVLGLYANNTTTTYAQRSNAGTYQTVTTSLAGAQASDYELATSGNTLGSLVINPIILSYILHDDTVTYGDTVTPEVDFDGVLSGDTVSAQISANGTPITSAIFAGNYTTSVTGLTGAQESNYVLGSGNTSSLIVNPRTLTYTVTPTTTVYGDQNNAPTATVVLSNLYAGDASAVHPTITVTDSQSNVLSPAAFDNTTYLGESVATFSNTTDAGSYGIAVGFSTSDSVNHPLSNYVLQGAGASGQSIVITPKPLYASMGAGANTIVYGSSGILGALASFNGFLTAGYGLPRLTMLDSNGNTVALGDPGPNVAGGDLIAGTDVGTYTVSVTSYLPQGNVNPNNYYIATSPSVNFVITPKTITYVAGSSTSTYGTLASVGASLSGIFGQDDVSAVVNVTPSIGPQTPVTLTAMTDAGSYTVGASGLNGAKKNDYQLATSGNTNGTLTINPLAVTWSVSDTTATYGTATQSGALGTATIDGVLSGDDVGGTVQIYAHNASVFSPGSAITVNGTTNANTYPMFVSQLTGASASNYTINTDLSLAHPGTLTVNPASIEIAPTSETLTYGTAYTPGYSVVSGFIYNGDASLLQVSVQYPQGIQDVGSYQITAQAFLSANYNITVLPGTWNVQPMQVQYFTNNESYTYGELTNTELASYGPSNFQAMFETMGGASIAIPYTPAVYYYQDSPVLNLTQQTSASSYPIIPSVSADYSLVAGRQGMLTIAPRPVDLLSVTSVYGSQPIFAIDPTIGGDNKSGPLAGDNLGVQINTLMGTTGASYNLVNVWNSNGGVVGGVPPVDTYTFTSATLTGTAGQNYVIANPGAATLTVTPKTISITSATPITVNYGTAPGYVDPGTGNIYAVPVLANGQLQSLSYSGLVYGGDALLIAPQMSAFAATTPVGTYSWATAGTSNLREAYNGTAISCVQVGCTNLNYTLATGGNTPMVTVVPKEIDYTVSSASTVYGTPVDLNVSFSGLLPQDYSSFDATILISAPFPYNTPLVESGANTSDGQGGYYGPLTLAPAGTYTLSLASFGGAAANNYVLKIGAGTNGTLTIAPKPITYSTASATLYAQVGDIAGSDDALGQYTLTGVIAGDQVGANLGITGYYENAPNTAATLDVVSDNMFAGTYPIIVMSLNGSQASNYAIASTGNSPGALTVVNTSVLNQLGFISAALPTTGGTDVYDTPDYSLTADQVAAGAEMSTGTNDNTLAAYENVMSPLGWDEQDVVNTYTGPQEANNATATQANAGAALYGVLDAFGYNGSGASELGAEVTLNNATQALTNAAQSGTSGSSTPSSSGTNTGGSTTSSGGTVSINNGGQDSADPNRWYVNAADTTGEHDATAQSCGASQTCGGATASYQVDNSFSAGNYTVNDTVTVTGSAGSQQNCGGGTCNENVYATAQTGFDASDTSVIDANNLTVAGNLMVAFAGAIGGSVSYGDSTGGVQASGDVSGGEFGFGGSLGASVQNGMLEVDMGLSAGLGPGIDFDIKFDVNVQALDSFGTAVSDLATGYTTSYTTFANPTTAQNRELLESNLLNQAQQLANSEQLFVSDIASGEYNADPATIQSNVQAYQQAEQTLANTIRADDFSLSIAPGGGFNMADNDPPATTVISTYNPSVFQMMGF